MTLFTWIFLGLVAGIVGGKIMGNTGGGIVLDGVLGVVGAVVVGYVFQMVGLHGVNGFNLWSLFAVVVGALIVFRGYHFVAQMRSARRSRLWESFGKKPVN
jgi:uncharacterized membrane protein YeaQ/YmgE (transglycosylase-associated protein family)